MGDVQLHAEEVAAAGRRVWADCTGLSRQPAASLWFRDQVAQLAPLGDPGTGLRAELASLPRAVAW